jgi:hypothetical protein
MPGSSRLNKSTSNKLSNCSSGISSSNKSCSSGRRRRRAGLRLKSLRNSRRIADRRVEGRGAAIGELRPSQMNGTENRGLDKCHEKAHFVSRQSVRRRRCSIRWLCFLRISARSAPLYSNQHPVGIFGLGQLWLGPIASSSAYRKYLRVPPRCSWYEFQEWSSPPAGRPAFVCFTPRVFPNKAPELAKPQPNNCAPYPVAVRRLRLCWDTPVFRRSNEEERRYSRDARCD